MVVDVQPLDVPFPAYRVRGTKTAQRDYVARVAMDWVHYCEHRRVNGAIMLDIDDTLLDGREAVINGFDSMRDFFQRARRRFPVHIVTARPRSDHANALSMLHERGFTVDIDRLHMLPTEHYYHGTDKDIVNFKHGEYQKMCAAHRGVVLRAGDRLWDVADPKTIEACLEQKVRETDCAVFLDPKMPGTLSCKLPGAK